MNSQQPRAALRLLYLLSAHSNPLYNGRHLFNGRFRTYGQHSFIYDLTMAGAQLGADINVIVDDLERFPISQPILNTYPLLCTSEYEFAQDTPTVAVIDMPSKASLSVVPDDIPCIGLVHNAFEEFEDDVIRRIDYFVCMTSTALNHQRDRIQASKLILIHQGVDLTRFRLRPMRCRSTPPRVLVCSRLDGQKHESSLGIIMRLANEPVDLTVVGDGQGFWPIADVLGADITLINFIPCQSIHRFIPTFDLIVSSGRGIMEALACGVPAIACGRSYAGAVLPSNILLLREENFTASSERKVSLEQLHDHIDEAMSVSPQALRGLAEEFFDARNFLKRTMDIARRAWIERRIG